jgi:hypothetical protein
MSTLEFDRAKCTITLLSSSGEVSSGPFEAYNNVDSHSKGPWPDGTYQYQTYVSHAELADPDSEYGSFGIFIFAVPQRTGMGVHSGREEVPDGLNRTGPQHCTLGCIRTTDEAMSEFLRVSSNDPLISITVPPLSEEARDLAGLLQKPKQKRIARRPRRVKAQKPPKRKQKRRSNSRRTR